MSKIELYNDDCLEILNRIKKENKNIIIVTDPPFNQGYHYNTYKDNKEENEYFEWLIKVFEGVPYVCIHYAESLYKLSAISGRIPTKVVSWVYNSNTAKQHRDIIFVDVKPNFKQVTQPYKNPNDKRIKERIARGILGGKLYDWWNENQVKNVSKEKTEHPCQMPLKVMENIVGILPKDCTVVDPFMGSGTTGVACKKHNIDFIGIEMDNKYFEIAKKRISEV